MDMIQLIMCADTMIMCDIKLISIFTVNPLIINLNLDITVFPSPRAESSLVEALVVILHAYLCS